MIPFFFLLVRAGRKSAFEAIEIDLAAPTKGPMRNEVNETW